MPSKTRPRIHPSRSAMKTETRADRTTVMPPPFGPARCPQRAQVPVGARQPTRMLTLNPSPMGMIAVLSRESLCARLL